MKRIVVIHGSPRKKTTYGITKQIEEIMTSEDDVAFDHVFLSRINLESCRGCLVCIRKDKCVIKNDDVPELVEKMTRADGIIFSSPVYMFTVTGFMKTFIDRIITLYHRPVLQGKPAMIVTSAEGSPIRTIEKYLSSVIWSYGMATTDTVWRNALNKDEAVDPREIREFRSLLHNPSKYNPSLGHLIMFKTLRLVSLISSDLDTLHWKQEGLYNKKFYFDCRINPVKLMIANLIYYRMSRKLKQRVSVEHRHLVPLSIRNTGHNLVSN